MQGSAPATRPRAALVTGGAQRIGRAIVLALARAGYAVAIHARVSRAEADALCAAIAAAGGQAHSVLADLGDHDAVLGLVSTAAAAIGPLTLLVNNAALFEPDEIGKLDRNCFDRQFAVNLRAPLFLVQAFAAQAPDGADASVVNLLDQRVYKPTPHFLTYGLTKSALQHRSHASLRASWSGRRNDTKDRSGTLPRSRHPLRNG